jgi:TatA/E family protein of Tat protein translocase
MESLLRPAHLVIILVIIIILFGPGKIPGVGAGLGRGVSDLRGQRVRQSGLSRTGILYLSLLAFAIGNSLYFLLSPFLPAAARLSLGFSSGLPVIVDLWICFMVFGSLNLLRLVRDKGPWSGLR